MAYTCEYLIFGGQSDVPGYGPTKCVDTQITPPIYPRILGTDGKTYDLKFVNCGEIFYDISSVTPVNKITAKDGEVINAWYSAEGPGGDHSVEIYPFLIGDEIDNDHGGVLENANTGDFFDAEKPFATFNPNPGNGKNNGTGASFDSKTMNPSCVTITILGLLCDVKEQQRLTFPGEGPRGNTLYEVINYDIRTSLDKIFVIGGAQPMNNTLTINKGDNCLALAVFKRTITELSTTKTPYSIVNQQYKCIKSRI
jgi:hypothetical protein